MLVGDSPVLLLGEGATLLMGDVPLLVGDIALLEVNIPFRDQM